MKCHSVTQPYFIADIADATHKLLLMATAKHSFASDFLFSICSIARGSWWKQTNSVADTYLLLVHCGSLHYIIIFLISQLPLLLLSLIQCSYFMGYERKRNKANRKIWQTRQEKERKTARERDLIRIISFLCFGCSPLLIHSHWLLHGSALSSQQTKRVS